MIINILLFHRADNTINTRASNTMKPIVQCFISGNRGTQYYDNKYGFIVSSTETLDEYTGITLKNTSKYIFIVE